MWLDPHNAEGGENGKRFPQRCAANRKLLGELPFGRQALTARERPVEDHLLNTADRRLCDRCSQAMARFPLMWPDHSLYPGAWCGPQWRRAVTEDRCTFLQDMP